MEKSKTINYDISSVCEDENIKDVFLDDFANLLSYGVEGYSMLDDGTFKVLTVAEIDAILHKPSVVLHDTTFNELQKEWYDVLEEERRVPKSSIIRLKKNKHIDHYDRDYHHPNK